MTVRDAVYEDIPQITGLIADFYMEAGFQTPPINPEKCSYILQQMITDGGDTVFFKAYDVGGYLAGAFLAERVPDLWSDAERVIEQFLYVRPPFRKRPGAGKMMLQFAEWAKERPAIVRVEASMGIDNDHAADIFERLGYQYRGTLHGMEAY